MSFEELKKPENREKVIDAIMEMYDRHAANAESPEDIITFFSKLYAGLQQFIDLSTEELETALRKHFPDKFQTFLALANMPESERAEIFEGLNSGNETGIAYCNDSPFIKALTKRGSGEDVSKVTIVKKNDLTIKSGEMQMFQKELFDDIIKAKREGKVTKSGWIYFTTGQCHKWISGGAEKNPSPEQTESIIQGLTEMGNNRIEYMTEKSLAELLRLDSEEVIPGFKFSGGVNAQLYEVRFYSGTEFRGQTCKDSVLVTIRFNEEVEKLLDRVGGAEPLREEIKRIQYVDPKTGALKTWSLGKKYERTALRTCLLNFVVSYTRARTPTPTSPAKPYSNKLPYDQIFALCCIDVSHNQKRKRKIEDIAIILDHFQRVGAIARWKEYKNRGSKRPDGIQIFIDDAAELPKGDE